MCGPFLNQRRDEARLSDLRLHGGAEVTPYLVVSRVAHCRSRGVCSLRDRHPYVCEMVSLYGSYPEGQDSSVQLAGASYAGMPCRGVPLSGCSSRTAVAGFRCDPFHPCAAR